MKLLANLLTTLKPLAIFIKSSKKPLTKWLADLLITMTDITIISIKSSFFKAQY